MSGADKTTKIENDHADEQIEVSGSEISSRTDENEEEFGKFYIIGRGKKGAGTTN